MSTATAIYPSVFPRMSEHRYHRLPQISRGQIVDFIESPMLYKKRHIERDPVWFKKPSDALDFGVMAHHAILVERDATKGWKVIPESVLSASGSRAGGKWKEWEAANEGVVHFKEHEVGPWLAMWESLQNNPDARRLLLDEHEGSKEEVTALWEYNGMGCRCRLDRVIPGCIADLKTCHSGDINAIRAEIEKRKLYIQAAWYSWGWKEATGQECRFVLVFVEKSPPFRTTCVDLSGKWIRQAEDEIFDALDRLQRRADRDDWSDPCVDQIFTLDRPSWANYALSICEDAVAT